MIPPRDDKSLDNLIADSIDSTELQFDAEQWKQTHPQAVGAITALTGRTEPPGKHQPTIWRKIMHKKITKLAAAAACIALALIAMTYFTGSPEGAKVAWADVVVKVQQAQSFMYRMKMKITGSVLPEMPPTDSIMPEMPPTEIPEIEMITLGSSEYGMKTTAYVNEEIVSETYVMPEQNNVVIIVSPTKQVMRMEFDEEFKAKMKQENIDPRDTIKEFMEYDYVELPRDIIDGIEVDGIMVTDPRFAGGVFTDLEARLWVSVDNDWPIRMEMSGTTGQMQIDMVMDDFQWDIPLDASDFEMIIPDDYTEGPSFKMPTPSAESAIDALRLFAEKLGHYPSKLDSLTIMKEFTGLTKQLQDPEGPNQEMSQEPHDDTADQSETPTEETMLSVGVVAITVDTETDLETPGKLDTKQKISEVQRDFLPLNALGMFHMLLVQEDKDPAYYGDTVGPEDVDAILMRWQSAENEYTIIYGDLTLETVTPDELDRLEDAQFE